jgi:hypothetical protein
MRHTQTNPMVSESYPHHSHWCGAKTSPPPAPVDPTLSGGGLLSETKPRAPRTELLARFQSFSQRQFQGGGLIPRMGCPFCAPLFFTSFLWRRHRSRSWQRKSSACGQWALGEVSRVCQPTQTLGSGARAKGHCKRYA